MIFGFFAKEREALNERKAGVEKRSELTDYEQDRRYLSAMYYRGGDYAPSVLETIDQMYKGDSPAKRAAIREIARRERAR